MLVSERSKFLKLLCETVVLRLGMRAFLNSEDDMQNLLIIGLSLNEDLPKSESKLIFLSALKGLQSNFKVFFQKGDKVFLKIMENRFLLRFLRGFIDFFMS